MTKRERIFLYATVIILAACMARAVLAETLNLSPGVNQLEGRSYDVTNNPSISADGVIVKGVRGQTVLNLHGVSVPGAGSDNWGFHVTGNRFELRDCIIVGANIFLDRNGGNDGIVFDNCEFRDAAINWTTGLSNSRITNNLFTGSSKGGGNGYGIFGYNYRNFTLANNEFADISAGAHIDAQSPSGPALVEQNWLHGVKAMGLEFQGISAGNVYQDNWFEHPTLTTVAANNTSSMAFSLILDKSPGPTKITRNVVIAPERPDGKGCRDGFEVGGDATDVSDNYVSGTECPLADNDGVGTGSVTAHDCRFVGYLVAPYIAFPTPTRTLTVTNCGPNVTLSAEMERRIAQNDRPGRNRRYGTPPATQPIPPTTNPVPPTTVPVYPASFQASFPNPDGTTTVKTYQVKP